MWRSKTVKTAAIAFVFGLGMLAWAPTASAKEKSTTRQSDSLTDRAIALCDERGGEPDIGIDEDGGWTVICMVDGDGSFACAGDADRELCIALSVVSPLTKVGPIAGTVVRN